MPRDRSIPRRLRDPIIAFVAGLACFGAASWDRLAEHSSDNHYVYMAEGMVHGRLHLEGAPPHRNDWAKYGDEWYVSFPPAPAVLMIPGVAIWGLDLNDRIFTLLFAAAGPALLLLLLQTLAAAGRIDRRRRDLWLLAALYGLGTVYFFAAVQGSVWYTAHMVGGVAMILFLLASLDGRHPLLAGLCLGAAFACRPLMLLAFPVFLYEALRPHAPEDARGIGRWLTGAVRSAGPARLSRAVVLFGLPVAAVIGLVMLMNWARFDDPFEFGHRYLQVRWAGRIEKWGLFNYHFLPRNLAVALASLPWLSERPPHIGISRHGLALWLTTPVLLWVLWPAARTRQYAALAIAAVLVALPSLLYQNTGWIQFGYRFSLDYTPLLMLMLAAGGRRFGKAFWALALVAFAVNLFGAVTFDRMWEFYPAESTRHLFQPD